MALPEATPAGGPAARPYIYLYVPEPSSINLSIEASLKLPSFSVAIFSVAIYSKMRHDVDVLIIGAGMSGIGLGIKLIQQHGTRNFEIIEKTENISGTWALNTYPGCGCDVSLRISVNLPSSSERSR